MATSARETRTCLLLQGSTVVQRTFTVDPLSDTPAAMQLQAACRTVANIGFAQPHATKAGRWLIRVRGRLYLRDMTMEQCAMWMMHRGN